MNLPYPKLYLNFDDFIQRVNADLIGKIVNIASRCAGFIQKHFNNQLAKNLHDPELYKQLLAAKPQIISAYNERDYARAIRQIMQCADSVNQYIDQHKPWVLAKEPEKMPEVQLICSMGLNAFAVLMAYLKPVLPIMAKQVETFLSCPPLTWETIKTPILDHSIQTFVPLMRRVEREQVDAMLAASKY